MLVRIYAWDPPFDRWWMQEAYSHRIAVRPERRRQFQKELVSSVHDAFRLLTDLLSQNPADQIDKVYPIMDIVFFIFTNQNACLSFVSF